MGQARDAGDATGPSPKWVDTLQASSKDICTEISVSEQVYELPEDEVARLASQITILGRRWVLPLLYFDIRVSIKAKPLQIGSPALNQLL